MAQTVVGEGARTIGGEGMQIAVGEGEEARCKRYNRELGAQTAMLPSLSPRE